MGGKGETGTIAREPPPPPPPPPPPLSLSCLPSFPPLPPLCPPHVNFTCTLLSECLEQAMNSDAAHFTSHDKTCLVTNQVVAGSREWFCFLQENLLVLCVSTAQGKLILCSKWRNTRVWCDSHSILSSQMSVFMQLATTWFFWSFSFWSSSFFLTILAVSGLFQQVFPGKFFLQVFPRVSP